MTLGKNNIFHKEHYKTDLDLTAINVTNKYALYNFLSTFSGTHYVTPRALTAKDHAELLEILLVSKTNGCPVSPPRRMRLGYLEPRSPTLNPARTGEAPDLADPVHRPQIRPINLIPKARKDHLLDRIAPDQLRHRLADRNLHRPLHRKPVHAATDRRKRQRSVSPSPAQS